MKQFVCISSCRLFKDHLPECQHCPSVREYTTQITMYAISETEYIVIREYYFVKSGNLFYAEIILEGDEPFIIDNTIDVDVPETFEIPDLYGAITDVFTETMKHIKML